MEDKLTFLKRRIVYSVFFVGICIVGGLVMMGCQKSCAADDECWVHVSIDGYGVYHRTYSQTSCLESSCSVNKNINSPGRHYCDCK